MRTLATVVATATIALIGAGSASALIVAQKGMAGVRLGMTQAKVESILGNPLAEIHGQNDFGPYTELRYPYRVKVFFQGNATVTSIETRGTHERTARDVGVGSTEAQVKAKVAGVRCETFFGFRSCYVGSFSPGTRVTDFHLRDGRVVRVVVGFVID